MSYALITQANYHEIQFGLYKNEELLEQSSIVKTKASSLLMDQLAQLLKKHTLSWDDIDFIGVNQGPAPFTTLRALITTVNGIAFATGIDLVGVDGLTSFAAEQYANPLTVVLLNAFGNDVYYAIQEGKEVKTGWTNGQTFLENLKKEHANKTITFTGNAAPLYQETITNLFGEKAQVKNAEYVSLQTVAQHCFAQEIKVPQLTPLYLKTQQYKPSC